MWRSCLPLLVLECIEDFWKETQEIVKVVTIVRVTPIASEEQDWELKSDGDLLSIKHPSVKME